LFFFKKTKGILPKKKKQNKKPNIGKKNIAPLLPQLLTINMKGCLRFFTFIFGILPNLAKFYTYQQFPLHQHHKVGGGEKISTSDPGEMFFNIF
jgi:hypothetical protein